MKKFLKIFGGIIIAVALAAGGYAVGSHNGMDNISTALPRVSLMHEAPPSNAPEMSGEPVMPKEDSIKDAIAEAEPPEPEKTGRTVVKTNESAALEGWTKIKSYSCSLMGNGDSSIVSIYTSAETVDDEIIWDDGQQWAVEVYDGSDGYYVLMDKYINNGSVYFEVTETDGKTAVNVYTKSGCVTDIKQYTYSKNGFMETTLYTSGTTNTLYSTIPNYQ